MYKVEKPMSPSNSNGNANMSATENGFINSVRPLDPEKTVHELIQHPHVQGVDDHEVESLEALQTIAKVLRRATEGKASAQAEAAEWKRKYELERARNLQLEQKGGQFNKLNGNKAENFKDQPLMSDESLDPCELCGGKTDISAHEVLRDGILDSDSSVIPNKMMRKASFKLAWCCKGDGSNRHKHDIVSFEKGNITFAERSSKQISLKWESPPHTVLILKKPNSDSVWAIFIEMVRWLKQQKNLNIMVDPEVRVELLKESDNYSFVQTWQDIKDVANLHTKVDFIVTLGGDGTVLWAASMFKGPVPPIVPFSLGSLGFMTQFNSEQYRESLNSILVGPITILLRHRLQCYIVPHAAKSEHDHKGPMLVLNEVTIDRGDSSFLTNLECYLDDSFLTNVQGDGLILSTTSGSTAYSLAAGGSVVHPQVPGILFTPICPHSLSFRPLILPEHVTVRVVAPVDSRGHAWVSFDGKGRQKLFPGDALVCSMAPWPVPTACKGDSTSDFLRSIRDGLHWNLRKTQASDGPRDT